jgi:hypothetical protein
LRADADTDAGSDPIAPRLAAGWLVLDQCSILAGERMLSEVRVSLIAMLTVVTAGNGAARVVA